MAVQNNISCWSGRGMFTSCGGRFYLFLFIFTLLILDVVVCKNIYNPPMANGSRYEYFICPQRGSKGGYASCCGIEDEQYCCPWIRTWRFYLTMVSVVLVVFCLCGLLVYICRKNLQKGGRWSHLTSRESGNLLGENKATNPSPEPPDRPPLTVTVPLDEHDQLALSYIRTIATNSSNNNRPLANEQSNADRRENVIQLFNLLRKTI
ncbi:hypothetical protein ScPMuIL_016877 [Solemya velum]